MIPFPWQGASSKKLSLGCSDLAATLCANPKPSARGRRQEERNAEQRGKALRAMQTASAKQAEVMVAMAKGSFANGSDPPHAHRHLGT